MEHKNENLWEKLRNLVWGELLEEADPTDIISKNAKSVLIGLFILIGFVIIFYAITISDDHFTKTYLQISKNVSKVLSPSPIMNLDEVYDLTQQQLVLSQQLQKTINSRGSNDNMSLQLEIAKKIYNLTQNQANSLTQTQSHSIENLSQMQKTINNLQRIDQQIEQINSVFIAAIAGALALGGTLITQLWGRKE
ncbi:MAG TPA: hypothetical protein VMS35_07860 [Nitrososphaeraceae archaeon]|nr:hypothetical protein [Nitrososphaeraceae archaeon]